MPIWRETNSEGRNFLKLDDLPVEARVAGGGEPVEAIGQPTLSDYHRFVVAFSGGKDSQACFLHLVELGVPLDRIELWHHDVDGDGDSFMDWPSTRAYCRAFADAFKVSIYFSGKEGGFRREMLREGARTAPVWFETPSGRHRAGGEGGKEGTRLKFPQLSADLSIRWCSSYLKIDVASLALNNQERFLTGKTLFITGERAEESAARARYKPFEPHRCDNRDGVRRRRHIDHWRPVHSWPEEQVWYILERHRINPAPAYKLGWGRLSCMACIFGSDSQWASIAKIAPGRFREIADYETRFGKTIHRTRALGERIRDAAPYGMDGADIAEAMSSEYRGPVVLPPDVPWRLPKGAFGESCGPV